MLIKSFRQAPSFANLISNNIDNKNFIDKYNGVSKCEAPGCLTCNIIQTGNSFNFRNIEFKIRSRLN